MYAWQGSVQKTFGTFLFWLIDSGLGLDNPSHRLRAFSKEIRQ
jgi:hypothetical protein